MVRIACVIVLAGLFGPRDLDVPIPPGSPMDWIRHQPKPVPTGARGGVPTPYRPSSKDPQGPGGTRAEESVVDRVNRPNDPVYHVLNAQEIYKAFSHDANGHLGWQRCPSTKPTGVSQDDVATEGGLVMQWNYPPEYPAELVWAGFACELRVKVHAKGISWPEAAAYCLEIGEPALRGALVGDGPIRTYLRTELQPDLPARKPEFPVLADPKESMLARLAAMELSGGFPHALDPSFGRRTLSLGPDAFAAVIACAGNAHPFLARNAVSVLGSFEKPEATQELLKLWKGSRDPVLKLRLMRALGDRREASIVKDLIAMLDGSAPPIVAAAIYALGRIGDPAAIDPIQRLLLDKSGTAVDLDKVDLLWSAIPALGKMGKGKEFLVTLERRFAASMGPNDLCPSEDPEPRKLLRQMCAIALARLGEKRYQDEVVGRVTARGYPTFHPVTWFALTDALVQTPRGAAQVISKVIEPGIGNGALHVEAFDALVRGGYLKSKELKIIASNEKERPAIRVRAMQELAVIDAAAARDLCADRVAAFSKGGVGLEPANAYVVAAAARIAGELRGLDAATLLLCVERAFNAKSVGQRVGNNDTDTLKMLIEVRPALLETLVIELGRTKAPEALPALKGILARTTVALGRPEAALALGSIPGSDAELVARLNDRDGWVRFCAYRALLHRSKQDFFCDWIFGDEKERAPATAKYEAWSKGGK